MRAVEAEEDALMLEADGEVIQTPDGRAAAGEHGGGRGQTGWAKRGPMQEERRIEEKRERRGEEKKGEERRGEKRRGEKRRGWLNQSVRSGQVRSVNQSIRRRKSRASESCLVLAVQVKASGD